MGTVDLIIVIAFLVASIFLIVACGAVVLTKQQLLFAAQEGAEYAAKNITHTNPAIGAQWAAQNALSKTFTAATNIQVRAVRQQYSPPANFGGVAWPLGYWRVTVSADCKLPGVSEFLPDFTHMEETAIVLARDNHPLLGVEANGSTFHSDGFNRPAHDRSLWLPVVRPWGGYLTRYLYRVPPDDICCIHDRPARLPAGTYLGIALPNSGVRVMYKDPR